MRPLGVILSNSFLFHYGHLEQVSQDYVQMSFEHFQTPCSRDYTTHCLWECSVTFTEKIIFKKNNIDSPGDEKKKLGVITLSFPVIALLFPWSDTTDFCFHFYVNRCVSSPRTIKKSIKINNGITENPLPESLDEWLSDYAYMNTLCSCVNCEATSLPDLSHSSSTAAS